VPVKLGAFVWIGSAAEASSADFLRRHRITHVLNCASDSIKSPGVLQEVGVQYLCLNARDEEGYPILKEHLGLAVTFLNEARDSGGQALVHCFMGTNRSVAIAVAYALHNVYYDYSYMGKAPLRRLRPSLRLGPRLRPKPSPRLEPKPFMKACHTLAEIIRYIAGHRPVLSNVSFVRQLVQLERKFKRLSAL
jgi:predicted protein tyrosine phosphatase